MRAHKKEPSGNGAGRQRVNPVSGCPLLAESPKHFAALRKLNVRTWGRGHIERTNR